MHGMLWRRGNRFATRDGGRGALVSRRGTILGGAAGLLAAAGAVRLGALAQDGTPEATPSTDDEPVYLFIQGGFESGTIEAKADAESVMVLTLQGAPAHTVFLGDRSIGAAPTQRAIDALAISPDNPRAAALIVEAAEASDEDPTDTVALELLAATYDPAAGTLTYEARVLENARRLPATRAGFGERSRSGEDVPASFGPSSLVVESIGSTIVEPES